MKLYLECVTVLFDIMSAIEHPQPSLAENRTDAENASLETLRMALTNSPLNRDCAASAWLSIKPFVERLVEFPRLDMRMQTIISGVEAPSVGTSKEAAPIPAYKMKSCYVQQEMHTILPRLFVGSYHPAASRARLEANGITHICCCINVAPRFPDAFSYLVLPADDNTGYDISPFFAVSFQFIDAALSSGGRVLVHCGAGISRAPTIAASYMIQKLGIGADDAIRMIKSIRSCASPNRGFVEHLRKLSSGS
jgi:hypothetical protein